MTAWPEWCVRQRAPGENLGCVWAHAPTAEEALSLTHAIDGPLGGWRTDIETEVFLRSEYAVRHYPRHFTMMVIAPRPRSSTPQGSPASRHVPESIFWNAFVEWILKVPISSRLPHDGSTLVLRLVRRADAKTSLGGSRRAAGGLGPLADAVVLQLLHQLPRRASGTVRAPVRPRPRSEPRRCLAYDPHEFVVFD